MKSLSSVVAVMLAAGSSRRFGADKRRAHIAGRPLLQQSLAIPLSRGLRTLLVLKPEDELCLEELLGPWFGNERLTIIYAENADRGMGYSLAAAVPHARGYEGLLVFLADMPYLKPRTVDLISDQFRHGGIVVPKCQGRQGHPVLFSQTFFSALEELRGDQGARSILAEHPDAIIPIEVKDLGVLQDIDYPLT